MKITKKRKIFSKKIAIICFLVLLLTTCVVVGVLYTKTNIFGNNPTKSNVRNINTIDYNPATKEQTKSGSDIKANNNGTDKPSEPTVVEGSIKKQVELVIINASKTKVNVQINTIVNSGTCTLTLTSPGQTTITQTTDVQSLASVSACKTFNYPEIPSGNWTIDVTYINSDLTGTITSTRSL